MSDHTVTSVEQLEAIYGHPAGAAVLKEIDHINAEYRAFIEAAPFFALSTCGPEGVDCSPRGDEPGFVRVADEKTLMIPDRRGNNRVDSLRNIVRDPRVSLLFLIPGVGETIRVIGTRQHFDRSGAARELRVRRQDAAQRHRGLGRDRLLPMLQGDHPLQAVGPLAPHRPRRACRATARFWPRSPKARWAARNTTAPIRSG